MTVNPTGLFFWAACIGLAYLFFGVHGAVTVGVIAAVMNLLLSLIE